MNKTDVEYYWCDSPVPPPFAPLTSKLPLSHMVPPGSCSPKGVWRAIILSIPLEEKNHHPQYIFGERFFLLFSWVYLFLFGSPFFSYPLFSLLFLFCEQSNWEPAWNERLNERKRKKTGLNINNIEFYFCFLIRGIFCEK